LLLFFIDGRKYAKKTIGALKDHINFQIWQQSMTSSSHFETQYIYFQGKKTSVSPKTAWHPRALR